MSHVRLIAVFLTVQLNSASIAVLLRNLYLYSSLNMFFTLAAIFSVYFLVEPHRESKKQGK